MKGFVQDLEGLAVRNEELRRVLCTAKHCQLVILSLRPKEEIGAEVHKLGLKASFSMPMVRRGQVRRVELAQTIDGHAPCSLSDRLTRVCRAHAPAAPTKPPSHRDRRLRPPRPSPARCQVRGVRARKSRRAA